MELNRRNFIKLFGAACAGGFAGFHHVFLKTLPAQIISAVKATCYPGKVKEINYNSVRRPGKWLG